MFQQHWIRKLFSMLLLHICIAALCKMAQTDRHSKLTKLHNLIKERAATTQATADKCILVDVSWNWQHKFIMRFYYYLAHLSCWHLCRQHERLLPLAVAINSFTFEVTGLIDFCNKILTNKFWGSTYVWMYYIHSK